MKNPSTTVDSNKMLLFSFNVVVFYMLYSNKKKLLSSHTLKNTSDTKAIRRSEDTVENIRCKNQFYILYILFENTFSCLIKLHIDILYFSFTFIYIYFCCYWLPGCCRLFNVEKKEEPKMR